MTNDTVVREFFAKDSCRDFRDGTLYLRKCAAGAKIVYSDGKDETVMKEGDIDNFRVINSDTIVYRRGSEDCFELRVIVMKGKKSLAHEIYRGAMFNPDSVLYSTEKGIYEVKTNGEKAKLLVPLKSKYRNSVIFREECYVLPALNAALYPFEYYNYDGTPFVRRNSCETGKLIFTFLNDFLSTSDSSVRNGKEEVMRYGKILAANQGFTRGGAREFVDALRESGCAREEACSVLLKTVGIFDDAGASETEFADFIEKILILERDDGSFRASYKDGEVSFDKPHYFSACADIAARYFSSVCRTRLLSDAERFESFADSVISERGEYNNA